MRRRLANATGAFIGRRVSFGSNVVFTKHSIFVCRSGRQAAPGVSSWQPLTAGSSA